MGRSEGKEEAKIGTEISFDSTILKRGKLRDNGGLSKWAFDFVMGKMSILDIKNIAKELGVHFTDAEIHAMVEEADRNIKARLSAHKVLFRHLQEKLNGIETKLKESQYQLAAWHSDVNPSSFAQSPFIC
ncbi:hypothetical protein Tco_0542741 [Tanacetum coccineum]